MDPRTPNSASGSTPTPTPAVAVVLVKSRIDSINNAAAESDAKLGLKPDTTVNNDNESHDIYAGVGCIR